MLVGVDFCFGKKVVDDVDFAKYDKVFFSKKTFFKKSVFSLFHTMFFFYARFAVPLCFSR